MDKLFAWQRKAKLSDKELADLLGYDPSMITYLRKKKRKMSPDKAALAEKITEGAVKKEELIWPE